MTKRHIKILFLFITTSTLLSCGFYSLNGISIAPETQTFQVNFFQNNSPLQEPGIDIQFTNTLRDLIQNQTSLSLVNSNGDLVYEGEISSFRIAPTNATSQTTAAQNRVTIGVNVRFFDKNDPDADLEQTFSFFFDYEGSELLTGATRDTALEEIFDRITQDIFNATLSRW